MILNIKRKKWIAIVSFAVLSVIIPVLIILFELVTTDKQSVVFLEGYPTPVSLLILLYYVFLFLLGLSWLVRQIISVFKLKHERAQTELLHLKSQVNPHFFFNTLNNLYGLVGIDTKKAQDLILKLSELMRYSIYEGEKEMVDIQAELDYMKNFIELHKMRYHKHIDIKFEAKIEHNVQVMPLLFIILLENAFKHGVEILRKDAFVHVRISAKNNMVSFDIENNFDPTHRKEDKGIGLDNLRRRLELVYPKKHSLSFSTTADIYKAKLTLEL